jgi:hypothetical protein
MSACQPDLPHTAPSSVVSAVFDPTTAKIPLPNDLALAPFSTPNAACPPPANTLPAGAPPACAQAELLASFSAGFPSDQEVAVTIDFTQTNFDAKGKSTQVAPDLDLTSFTDSTFFVYGTSGADQGVVQLEPITPADYVKSADHGTLSIHHHGHEPWAPGTYAVLVRGGASGVKTVDGIPVSPSQVFDLIAQGLDMTDPKNIGLLKAQTGTKAAALEQGAQLNLLIGFYKRAAFPVADMRFPHQELAILTTFKIAPTVTNVTIDPARSEVPLPIDLLRDPTSGKLSTLAACTLANAKLAADGSCPSPAAAGFKALDGFSTTGTILAPTSDIIKASTVTSTSVMLFNLSNPANPVQVPAANLIFEPCELTKSGSSVGCGSLATALSTVIAIQPAGATAGDADRGDTPSVFRTKPLKDNTDYAVVMTTDIKDKAGNSIGPGTVAKVVRFTNPVSVGGHSQLQGIDDTTAASLEKMRLQLQPVFTKLAAAGMDSSKIAMAYTFHTQTIVSQAVQLAALPYTTPAATALPGPVTATTPAAAFAKYGASALPQGNIDEILEADITTFNALDPATGAFLADPTKAVAETIHVLIATPKADNANIPACTGALAPFGKCAPLMVFRHGLGRGRADMLTVANTYAGAGMVTVAIDAAKHGDRTFCTSGTSGTMDGPLGKIGGCNTGVACVTTLPAGAQNDANPPGTCADGKLSKKGVDGSASPDGIPELSGNYLVSVNFFRTRDTMRQDLIDESQLIRAIAVAPPKAPPIGHTVFDHIVTRAATTFATSMIIDPTTIYYSGQSLGAIQGAMDVASNPRISKAVLNVGGGTIVDIFTNSPAFKPIVDDLLANALHIERGSPAFLQFLVVAKTILDPADPINFVGHLTANTLPNLLPPLGGNADGSVPQAPKKILTQVANCDGVVPNPFSLIYASNVPTAPVPPTGAKGSFQLFVGAGFNPGNPTVCSATTAVEHGFFTDWVTPARTLKAQSDAADFVMNNNPQNSIE